MCVLSLMKGSSWVKSTHLDVFPVQSAGQALGTVSQPMPCSCTFSVQAYITCLLHRLKQLPVSEGEKPSKLELELEMEL